MKKLVEINVNNINQDCVIDYYMSCKRDNEGKIICTKPENGYGPHEGKVYDVVLYIKGEKNPKQVNVINISPKSIKALYKEIIEIEALESEELV